MEGTFSPHDQYVIAADNQKSRLVVWDLETGKEISHFQNAEEIEQVYLFPGGRSALFVTGRNGLSLRDVVTGQEIRSFAMNTDPIAVEVAFSPDGRCLVSTEVSIEHNISRKVHRVIRVWDIQTGQEIRQFAALTYGASIKAVYLHDNRHLLYAGDSDSNIRICDVQTGNVICRFSPYDARTEDEIDSSSIWSIAISSDGRLAASGHHDGTIRLWDLNIDR